jgi:hypothetical protein
MNARPGRRPAARDAGRDAGRDASRDAHRDAHAGHDSNLALPGVTTALVWATSLFLLHAAALRHFLIDDAFIVYRVAHHFASGLGPVFNPGERVESFTDPLYTFLLAPFAALTSGTDALPALARMIGVIAGAGSLVVLATVPLPGRAATTALALLLCAVSTSMTAWSVGGLETSLYGLLIVSAFSVTLRRPASAPAQVGLGLLLAAVMLSRPDGVLPAAALLVWRWIDPAMRTDRSAHLRIALAALLPALAYLAFRRLYFGEWVPNTYFAKHAPLALAVPNGFAYLGDFLSRNGTAVFYAPALLALRHSRREPVIALAALVLAAYLPYVVVVGGDWMDAHRFVAPVIPLVSLLVAAGWVSLFGWIHERFAERGGARLAAAVVPAGSLLVTAVFVAANVANTRRVRDMPYVNATPYYATMGRLVDAIAQPHWTVAADDIGAIGWYGRIRVLDLLGLANPDMAHRRTTPQKLVADHVPGILILHYDDSRAPRSRWRTLSIADFDSLYVRPRGPVPLPGSLRVSRRVLPWVEARLAELPASLDTDLVRLDAYLERHQPDMRPLPAGVAP